MPATVTEEAFLSRVNEGNFVADIDGRTITTTSIPSAARHLSYEMADRLTQDLRRRGYRQAVVTDFLGQPVSADAIRSALALSRVAATDPLPKTRKELALIPSDEYKMRRRNDPAFRKRVDELEAQPPKASR